LHPEPDMTRRLQKVCVEFALELDLLGAWEVWKRAPVSDLVRDLDPERPIDWRLMREL
jgi:hypothetical protein